MSRKKDSKTAERTVDVVDSSYQPSKAELKEDMSIDKTPDEVAKALTQTVNVRRVKPTNKAATGRRERRSSRE